MTDQQVNTKENILDKSNANSTMAVRYYVNAAKNNSKLGSIDTRTGNVYGEVQKNAKR